MLWSRQHQGRHQLGREAHFQRQPLMTHHNVDHPAQVGAVLLQGNTNFGIFLMLDKTILHTLDTRGMGEPSRDVSR